MSRRRFVQQAVTALAGAGGELRFFPKEMMDAAQHETFALYEELAAKHPRFALAK